MGELTEREKWGKWYDREPEQRFQYWQFSYTGADGKVKRTSTHFHAFAVDYHDALEFCSKFVQKNFVRAHGSSKPFGMIFSE